MNVVHRSVYFDQPGRDLSTTLIGCSLGHGGPLTRPTVLTISKYVLLLQLICSVMKICILC